MTKIELFKGDITKVQTDVIVNAANSSLLGGGGVDGAIHRAGGAEILEECMDIRARQGGCATGEVVITTAGKLAAKKVIHTVGPVWQRGKAEALSLLLANCYKNSLALAAEYQYTSIAFPNISTGIYRFPKKRAAEIAIASVQDYLQNHQGTIKEVLFVCFDEENYHLYRDLLEMK
ncbi:MAG: O-acetyl-ADP-ribose deacetylase [Bacteroidota bacterium]